MGAIRALVPKGPWVERTWWTWCLRRIIQAAGGRWPGAVSEHLHLTLSLKWALCHPQRPQWLPRTAFQRLCTLGGIFHSSSLPRDFFHPSFFLLSSYFNKCPATVRDEEHTHLFPSACEGNWHIWSVSSVFAWQGLKAVAGALTLGTSKGFSLHALCAELLLSRERASHAHYLKQFCEFSARYWPIIRWTLLKTSE